MNDRLLKIAVALSVFAMVGMGLMGTAAADQTGLNDVEVGEEITVRADNPGESLTLEIDISTDGNAGTTTTYVVDTTSLENAGVESDGSPGDLSGASLTATAVTGGASAGGESYSAGSNEITFDYTDDGSQNVETVELKVGTVGGASLNTGPSQNENVAPGSSYAVSVQDSPGNFGTVSTQPAPTIDAAEIDIGQVARNPNGVAPGGSLNLGSDIIVGVSGLTYNSDTASVVTSNVDGQITIEQPELGDRKVDLGGTVTGDQRDVAAENLIEGDHTLSVKDGDLTDGTAAANDGEKTSTTPAYTVDGLRLDLDTPESVEALEDVVLYNSAQSVSGSVFRTSENAPTQVLADDRTINYEFLEPGTGNTVAAATTNDGQFSVSETWDATRTVDDDSPGTDRQTYERLDGLQYDVNVGDGGTPTSGSQASNTFSTVLDIEFEVDGVSPSQADVTFDDTVQISGTVRDGQGNPIGGYRVTSKLYADTLVGADVTSGPIGGGPVLPATGLPVEVGTTTTGNNGQFSFTQRLNDGVQDPEIDALTGLSIDNIGVHLGTHLVDRDEAEDHDAVDDGGDGVLTDSDNPVPHPAVHYQTVETQPQEDIIEVTADSNAPAGFQDTYRIRVTDKDGNPLDGTAEEAIVTIEGELEGSGTFGAADGIDPAADISTGTDITFADDDVDGDTNLETVAFQAVPDSNGFVNFTATSLQGSFDINVTGEDFRSGTPLEGVDSDEAELFTLRPNVAAPAFSAVRYTEPDYADDETFQLGQASPVNIIDEDVEDTVTSYDETDVTNDPDGNFQSIFSDNGPEVVEVLPLTDLPINRIESGTRLGFDENFDLDGITAYRVQFELRNSNNEVIIPEGGTTGPNEVADFERIDIDGAGINGTIFAAGGGGVSVEGKGILDAQYDPAGFTDKYVFLIRPTSVEEQNPTIDHSIKVDGENPVSLDLDANGLEIANFTVDGQPTDAIEPNQNVDVTAVVEDATQSADGVPINNGRVRLSQNNTELGDFDARTANTNDGEYSFQDISVGPRGFDNDGDGIGEEISTLDFTAYQYDDADSNQRLDQREVNKATVEQLDLLADGLEVEYDPTNTSKYSGFEDGAFTLTRGVEYEQIAFELTDEQGNPVDLTDGLGGNNVPLNDIAFDAPNAPTDPELVTLTSGPTELSVSFDTSASDPADGFYVIDDIEEGANVDTSSGGFSNSDTFVIGAPGTDAGPQAFTLNVETPDRSLTTDEDTGTFLARDADVETEVIGVAGSAVPNDVKDGENTASADGNLIDELNNDQTDISQGRFNTNTSGIETPTGGANINRVYRIDATATDALGTPLSDADFNEIVADFDGSTEPPGTSPDVAQFAMVDGPDVTVRNDDGFESVNFGSGNIVGGNDEVVINNEDGEFQFDIEVESTGTDGSYTPVFEIQAQADASNPPPLPLQPNGKSDATQAPTVRNPDVNVFSQNGGDLPLNTGQSGNQILANDLPNELRIEAFPADDDGFVLPDGIQFSLGGSFAETQVSTTTQNINDVQTSQLATEGFDEGQIGFVQATPTGTGIGFSQLFIGGTPPTAPTFGAGTPVIGNATGQDVDLDTPILFDVLTSNRELDLGVSPSDPTGLVDSVTVTATDTNDNELVGAVSVTVEGPDGDTITNATDANGEAVVPASFIDEEGTYEIDTRRAGYGVATASFSVDEVASGPGPSPGEVVDAIRSAGNDPNALERQSIQDAIFAFAAGDGTFNGTEMTREGLEDAVFEFVSP